MKEKPNKEQQIHQLLNQVIDGQPDPETVKRLGDLLHGDPQACEAYLDQMTLHAFLQREWGGQVPLNVPSPESAVLPSDTSSCRRVSPKRLSWTYVAAGLLLLMGLLLGFLLSRRMASATEPSHSYVAQLQSVVNAHWEVSQAHPPHVGDRIRAGEFTLISGLAELELFDGAVVALEGPAHVDLVSPGKVILHHGILAACVPARATGFTVETPVTSVIDFGTRFGVKVDKSGTTETHVFDGEVGVTPHAGDKGPSQRLLENTAVRINARTKSIEPIPSNALAYPRPTQSISCLVHGDFAPGTEIAAEGIPTEEGRWSGDPAAIVSAEQGITPRSGIGMLKFLSTNLPVMGWDLSTGAAQQWQLVDLRTQQADIDAGRVTAEASVFLNRVTGDAFTDIRLAVALHAFKGDPAQARDAWERRGIFRLGRAEAEIPTDSLPATWERADIRLPIPRYTQFLILEIRAVENVFNDIELPEFDGHYADDVSLILHTDAMGAH
jgi:ferric-dicitrate binding protein FerR (iron transport regulator)